MCLRYRMEMVVLKCDFLSWYIFSKNMNYIESAAKKSTARKLQLFCDLLDRETYKAKQPRL